MSNLSVSKSRSSNEVSESFGTILSEYERNHSPKGTTTDKGREGTVIAVSGDSVFLDVGLKTEGILPLAAFKSVGETVRPGDRLLVTIKGRDPEGY